MAQKAFCLCAVMLQSCALAGCGAAVPIISEPWERQDFNYHSKTYNEDIKITSTGQMEYRNKKARLL